MSDPAFIQIDEEGRFHSSLIRITDENVGHKLISSLQYNSTGSLITNYEGKEVFVEAFDEPLVAEQVTVTKDHLDILFPYGFSASAPYSLLTLDEWDRFHGLLSNGLPFVLSRKAQNELFNSADEFTDTSIQIAGKTYELDSWLPTVKEVGAKQFWDDRYLSEQRPGWDMDAPVTALIDTLPQLKLNRSRVLVPGAGFGHDANHWAQKGHIVRALDFSEEAIKGASSRYAANANLTFENANILELPHSFDRQFDVVFEHTLFCAVGPQNRNKMIDTYSRCLINHGLLVGVFFIRNVKNGPPFGSTEWELRERLKKKFNFLYWTRWRRSTPARMGQELLVVAQKKVQI